MLRSAAATWGTASTSAVRGTVLEFRILGPVEVWSAGTQKRLRGVRNQRVLAVLLLEAGHTVAVSRLVDAVWGDDPPASAVKQVRNTISSLRALVGADRIVGDAAGYRIELADGELDARVFQAGAAQAAEYASAGDLMQAAGTLADALALWRGRALAGLDSQVIEAAADAWEERRAAARETLSEYELALGRHAAVLPGLMELVAEHPLREKPVSQLMTALYRGGRQSEALALFTEFRGRLTGELGLNPSAELRELHQRILAEDLPAIQPAATGNDVMTRRAAGPMPAGQLETSTHRDDIHAVQPPQVRVHDEVLPARRRRLIAMGMAAIAATFAALAGTILAGGIIPGRFTSLTGIPAFGTSAVSCPARPDPGDRPLVSCDDVRFVADVTIPDGTTVRAGHTFAKTWEIQNTGLIRWQGRYLTRQGLLAGPGLCASVSQVAIPPTQPGQDVQLSVTFTAPSLPGSCRVDWKMTNGLGQLYFPDLGGLYVIVNVTG